MVTPTELFDEERHAHAEGWALATRVALALSVLAAALALALTTFAGVPALPVVAAVGAVGLAVGLRLPPAWPPRPAVLRD
jgi:small-conductance mechanosensitive channel